MVGHYRAAEEDQERAYHMKEENYSIGLVNSFLYAKKAVSSKIKVTTSENYKN